MPATPAWPPSSLPRLFVDQSLAPGLALSLDGPPANYLVNVLRLGPGAQVKLFDDRTGEWLAQIVEAGRKRIALSVTRHLRDREPVPDLWLLFAPIKRGRIDWLVEKATELGVARLVPVLTRRTIVERLNLDRLRAHVVEAAEQCERTALTELAEPEKLAALLAGWPAERALYFADETGGEPLRPGPGPAAILIGPEGGFTDEERSAIRSVEQARAIGLGPRILRADTAALAAVALWMGASGDWAKPARARSRRIGRDSGRRGRRPLSPIDYWPLSSIASALFSAAASMASALFSSASAWFSVAALSAASSSASALLSATASTLSAARSDSELLQAPSAIRPATIAPLTIILISFPLHNYQRDAPAAGGGRSALDPGVTSGSERRLTWINRLCTDRPASKKTAPRKSFGPERQEGSC